MHLFHFYLFINIISLVPISYHFLGFEYDTDGSSSPTLFWMLWGGGDEISSASSNNKRYFSELSLSLVLFS